MPRPALPLSLLLLCGALTACVGPLTAPAPISKAIHLVTDAQVLAECGQVVLSGLSTTEPLLSFRLVVPDPASTAADAPHPSHLDLKANGFARTRLTPDEYTFTSVYATSVVMKRPGAYVFKGTLANTSMYALNATCGMTGRVSVITVTARVTDSTPGWNAPVVFRLSTTPAGELTGQLREFPLGSTPEQLGLP